uniref:Tetratricopeptide repeat protein n=1 Tax=Elaeophora elaphi TaxID=1147741 RepID=A0A0R3RGK6_9BILA
MKLPQEGLSTYLEWIITKSLDNSSEIDELISEKRREGIMKDSTTSTTIISEFHSPEDISRCFDKPATFFVMLELGFGQGTVAKVVKLLMQRYAYASAGLMEWRQVIDEAANDRLAGEFFEKYFTQPGLPLIRVSSTAEGINLTQSVTAAKRVINSSSAIIPLDVAVIDVADRTVLILSNETKMVRLKHNGLMVVDPDRRTHTIIVYEPEVYLRLVQCTEVSSCSTFLKPETMKRIANDFCWAFLGNHFTIPENMPQKARIWTQFMQILSETKYVHGSCACCMNKNLERSGSVRCSWHWNDVCEELRLLKQIQHFTSLKQSAIPALKNKFSDGTENYWVQSMSHRVSDYLNHCELLLPLDNGYISVYTNDRLATVSCPVSSYRLNLLEQVALHLTQLRNYHFHATERIFRWDFMEIKSAKFKNKIIEIHIRTKYLLDYDDSFKDRFPNIS